MYRTVEDFKNVWQFETNATLKCFSALTEDSLKHRSEQFPRGLGRLAQHIAEAPSRILWRSTGVELEQPEFGKTPVSTSELVRDYELSAKNVTSEVSKWSDEDLEGIVDFVGMKMPRGALLHLIVTHQAHHRGQLTVLMHEAGTPSPGFYGPTAVEQKARGMEPMP
jgi:uncharacterized damage-inducible protein DinB